MKLIPTINPIESDDIDLSRLESACMAKNVEIPKNYKLLISRLLKVHFTGKISVKPNGDLEIAIPDPKLLCSDGPKELRSKHLYVNLTKYLEHQHNFAARCVKNGKVWDIEVLKNMEPLFEREKVLGWNPKKYAQMYLSSADRLFLSPLSYTNLTTGSEDSNKDCFKPGKLIPVTELDKSHPAIIYLNSRGFYDMESLYNQFELSYCIKESDQWKHITTDNLPDTIKNYKVNPLGFTPQGRLVFHAKHFGVCKLWQARCLEMDIGDDKYYYSQCVEEDPISKFNKWIKVASKNKDNDKFEPVHKKFTTALKRRYIICPGTTSSNSLLGFDAAIKWNKLHRPNPWDSKIIGIAEGPLDAARMGAPFCSIMGSALSLSQMKLISNNFGKLIYAPDHDSAGNSMRTKLKQYLSSLIGVEVVEMEYPSNYKDLGSITDQELINSLKEKYLK